MPDKRPPAVAGQFYPASKQVLREKIEECFKNQHGPGKVPELDGGEREIKGAVVPHAGYDFSGPVAAHVYGAIAEDGFPETFIILGPKHSSPFRGKPTPEAGITTETFDMPFGDVPVDQELADELLVNPIELDPDMHASEHSIEVQLPFLQYFTPEIKFVPICISSQNIETATKIGEILREATQKKDVVIIASTDLTHCGPRYGQSPPSEKSAGEFAEEQDQKAIEKMTNMDARGLSSAITEENITMCGPGGVEALTLAIKKSANEGELLKHMTSEAIMPGRNAVGYGGIIFK